MFRPTELRAAAAVVWPVPPLPIASVPVTADPDARFKAPNDSDVPPLLTTSVWFAVPVIAATFAVDDPVTPITDRPAICVMSPIVTLFAPIAVTPVEFMVTSPDTACVTHCEP